MIIDLVFAILLLLGILKGYRRGLIAGIFFYLAFIIGIAAAMKLSAVVAAHIGPIVHITDRWLPFISFLIVFIGVVMLVQWIARLLQTTFEKIMLGWVNRIGGIILFAALYISIYAIFLFYLNQVHLLPDHWRANSITYGYITHLGQFVIDYLGYLIPLFKNLFAQLEAFFANIATK